MLTKSIIENLLILAGESFWVAGNFAQLHKLLLTHNKRGLSAANQTLNAAGNIAWICYFGTNHLWLPFVSNLAMFGMTATIVAILLTNKRQFFSGITAISFLGPITGFVIVAYPNSAGWLGVAFNFIAASPWVLHVVRTKKTSGISERSLMLAWSAMTCTLIYGFLVHSAPLVVGCLIGITYNIIIAVYYYRYRHVH